MCGLLAWVSTGGPPPLAAIEAGTDALAHRGPDGRGVWTAPDGRAALGHRRLSILDLSEAGAQPMHLEGRDLHLVYNGEIYNHPDLRAELEARGHAFRSDCDSETVLRAYAEWGEEAPARLNGIYAFAIWDGPRGRLVAARDPLGVKPLYLAQAGGGVALASQPRALLPLMNEVRADPEAMADALRYGVVPGEGAIFAGMRKLAPGELWVHEAGRDRRRRFWSLPEAADIHDAREAEARLEAALEGAVAAQLMADVPVTTFLSGGIDSSLVTAIAARHTPGPLTAFTMGFDEARSDERPFAARAAEATGAAQVVGVVGTAEVPALIEEAAETFDEPFGIGAALPMLAVSRLAAAHGAKVVLTGDGADELFAGYRHYDAIAARYARAGRGAGARVLSRPRALWDRLRRGPFDPRAGYTAHNGAFPDGPGLFAGPALADADRGAWREAAHLDPARDPVDAAQRADVATYMADEILVKVDRATMAHGIEARVPLLDLPLVELAFRIDPAIRHAGGERKALLKRAARRWLPEDVLSARKKGFSLPVAPWAREPATRARIEETLREGVLAAQGWIDAPAAIRAAERAARPAFALLHLYLLERWAGRWLGR